jgi:hypothetical protein
MKLELAKAGLADNGQHLSEADIAELVQTFAEVKRAPVVLGHRQADHMPAFGYVTALEKQEDKLFGEVELMDPLAEAYNEGYYRSWSIGAKRRPKDGRLYLHHLAFLGAAPPAIKGLEVVSMSEAGELTRWDFAEGSVKSAAKTDWPVSFAEWDADAAVDRIIEKGGFTLLSHVCAAYTVAEGDEDPPQVKERYHFPFADVIDGRVHVVAKAVYSGIGYLNGARGAEIDAEIARAARPVLEKLQQLIEEDKEMGDKETLEKENKDLKAKLDKAQKDLEDLQNKNKEFSDQQEKVKTLSDQLDRVSGQLKDQKKEELRQAASGRLPKQQLDALMELAGGMDNTPLEFSDKSKKEPLDVLKEIFSAIPQPVEEGRLDLGDPPGGDKENQVDAGKMAQVL